ncbi:hypothetical protein DH09_06090 [Bacillaceae bacterium JMAK1]|nr:hypothetical protein DH09_06090 [Bacillaceae bacterium JMAK1]
MEQNSYMMIENHEQLKAVSDPFRSHILTMLVEQAYTGQQLAKTLEVPRSKVHYALLELERNKFIKVVHKEEKKSVVQKFYKAVAKSYFPSEQLMPHAAEVGDYFRGTVLNVLQRARLRALAAPDEAFKLKSSDPTKRPAIAMQVETRLREDQFIEWIAKYRKLVDEFYEMDGEGGKPYYLTTIGFQLDEPFFEEIDTQKKRDSNEQ